MNYLAHAYLSFGNTDLLVGNMISDFVKGKKKYDYPLPVQHGINLHRAIDEFTDAHPATKKAIEYFRADYRLYSGAFIDVVYDHFLARDTNEFKTGEALLDFSLRTYQTLEDNFSLLPSRFQNILPHMQQHNWLYNYQYPEGIQRSFGGLVYRAAYIYEWDTAFTLFTQHYEKLKECYAIFFPSVKKFASLYVSDLPLG